jgi:hypothetical protein
VNVFANGREKCCENAIATGTALETDCARASYVNYSNVRLGIDVMLNKFLQLSHKAAIVNALATFWNWELKLHEAGASFRECQHVTRAQPIKDETTISATSIVVLEQLGRFTNIASINPGRVLNILIARELFRSRVWSPYSNHT